MPAPRYRSCFNDFLEEEDGVVEIPAPPDDAAAFHRSIPGYQPTPLYSLPSLADELGVGQILVKDESARFGLKAFKALGASYAVYRLVKKAWAERLSEPFDPAAFLNGGLPSALGKFTFASATEGNHGKALAWMARRLKAGAVIFMPKDSARARIKGIEDEGARVELVDGTYDDAVKRAAEAAQAEGWQVVSDTAYEGNAQIPAWVMGGYSTLFGEIDVQLKEQVLARPEFMFVQGGAGGLAGATVQHYPEWSRGPSLICVEPFEADCLLESISSEEGDIHRSRGTLKTIMAGLNCGTPSALSWPLIRARFDYFLAIDDIFASEAMNRLYRPATGDPRITAGESGAAGLAGLFALCRKPELEEDKDELGITDDSTILVINTEGDTDPDGFKRAVDGGQ